MRTAAQYGNKPLAEVEAEDTGDISLTVESQDGVSMGSDINVRILLRNGCGSRRRVSLSMAIAVMYYNGICKESFKNEECNVQLNPGEGKSYHVIFFLIYFVQL